MVRMRDSADFDAFYTSTARRMLLHAYAMCGDINEAQDIVQDAYARAWQHWPTIGRYEDPEGWIRMVAWRLTANRWRGLKRWLAARARLTPAPPTLGPSPDRVAVATALQQIPEAQRLVVIMHYLYGLPLAEIASQVGAPVGTVKVRLFRARSALVCLLDEREMETDHAVGHA